METDGDERDKPENSDDGGDVEGDEGKVISW